ncbi:MAG: hypothetical protein RIB86_07740 [Imperialibacter sp.]
MQAEKVHLVSEEEYFKFFVKSMNPYVSREFLLLNSKKTESLLFVVNDVSKATIGIVLGVKNNWLLSPFSAPFGGLHYKHENIYISQIEEFFSRLIEFTRVNRFENLRIILPPTIYNCTFNAKAANVMHRLGFSIQIPDLTNWIRVDQFKDSFTQKNAREYYNQSLRNNLTFLPSEDPSDKEAIYDIICQNRAKFGRPIFMSFKDIMEVSSLWKVDFFKVVAPNEGIVAGGIFYRFHPQIVYALFWGDTEEGRPLRAMDSLSFHLYSFYKVLGYQYIDLGISTENGGNPNEGLLRFKEMHEADTELRFTYLFEVQTDKESRI